MHEHALEMIVDAEVPAVWRTLHPRRPPGAEVPWRIDYAGGTIEVLTDADEAGQELVRLCTFRVPRYLLSGGVARSFESIVEARLNELSRYSAVGKPLWSHAGGWHRLEEVASAAPDSPSGRATTPTTRSYALLERRVHQFISAANTAAFDRTLRRLGPVERVGYA
jgi:hypothetical protein